ncbi:serine protease inhibitor Kazal-type 4-like [Antennarius striatus]|uniref:serine protease inhibitor Kazal-type 4-like n=1 Tax=Antennarius striatus TaxID=241820 RepID=UPI0035AFDA0E
MIAKAVVLLALIMLCGPGKKLVEVDATFVAYPVLYYLNCPETRKVVCGNDGQNYQNPCSLRTAGVKMVKMGLCQD